LEAALNDRFAEQITAKEARKDTRLLGDFTVIYCRAHHVETEREPLASDGAELGVYGRKTPEVCHDCAELLRYAEKRRAFCPKDPKPFCSYCDTHCYKSDMREYMQQVMRFAGPRSMWHGHAIDGVKHMIEGKRQRAALELELADDE
jgi:hypothetical protein